jgi:hypothetical protein
MNATHDSAGKRTNAVDFTYDDIGNRFGFEFALLFGFGDGVWLLVLFMEELVGQFMDHYSCFGRGREAGANNDSATGRVAFDAGFSDLFVVEDDVKFFFSDPFEAAE